MTFYFKLAYADSSMLLKSWTVSRKALKMKQVCHRGSIDDDGGKKKVCVCRLDLEKRIERQREGASG